jgi:hypothetical protein
MNGTQGTDPQVERLRTNAHGPEAQIEIFRTERIAGLQGALRGLEVVAGPLPEDRPSVEIAPPQQTAAPEVTPFYTPDQGQIAAARAYVQELATPGAVATEVAVDTQVAHLQNMMTTIEARHAAAPNPNDTFGLAA